MKNFFKGFVIGIGKIIPGVSGAMLAISMGVYDKALDCICNFKNKKKESIKYLFPIALGIILSVIFFSRIIAICLSKFYVITMLFFIGLIIGGIPSLMEKTIKENYKYTIISFIAFFLLAITNINNVYIMKNNFIDFVFFMLSGLMEAIGTIVPGVSGTALLMILGTYNIIITAIGSMSNIKVLIPFFMGTIIGILVIIKVINYLFKKYEEKLYSIVFGILLSSIVLLIIQTFKEEASIFELVMGFVFLFGGIAISLFMEEKK